MEKNEKKYIILLLLTVFIAFFTTLWIPNSDLMETRNFITAKEMVYDGNWLTPTMNGAYRFEKPPFPTWITAFFMQIFNGLYKEWILRLPAAIISSGMVLAMYRMVKTLTKKSLLSFLCAFSTATSFFLMKEGITNSWDIFSYATIFISVVFLNEGLEKGDKISYIIAAFFFGASIMSKGPVAIYGLFIPYIIAYGKVYGIEKYKQNWKGLIFTIILGSIIGVLWPAYMLIENKELFLSVMKKEQNTWSSIHSEPFYFFFNYFTLTGPWVLFALGALIPKWNKKKIERENVKIFNFGLIWTLTSLFLLSIVKMKKQRYGFPIYLACPITIGVILEYYWNKADNQLEKIDKGLFQIQRIILIIVLIGIPLLMLIKGIIPNKLNLSYFIIVLIAYMGILFYILKEKFYEGRKFKTIIVISGIVMLLVNSTAVWFINSIRSKQKENLEYLKSIRGKIGNMKVYSADPAIENVWKVGEKINYKFDGDLPNNFIFLSRSSNEDSRFRGYNLINKKKYYQFEDDNEIIYLYEFKN